MVAVEAELLKGGHTKLVIMIIVHRSDSGAQHLCCEVGNRLGRGIHPVNDSLELLVGERSIAIVPLNDPEENISYSLHN